MSPASTPELNEAGVDFILIGAHALGVYTKELRATKDVDVMVNDVSVAIRPCPALGCEFDVFTMPTMYGRRRMGRSFEKRSRSARLRWRIGWCLLAVFLPGICHGADQASEPTSISFSAVVEKVSPIPDPKTSVYQNCLVAVRVTTREALRGPKPPESLIAVFWAFRDKIAEPAARLVAGDLLEISAIRFADATMVVQSQRQADTIDEIELPRYLVTGFKLVGKADLTPVKPASHPAPPAQAPVEDAHMPAKSLRSRAIASDLRHIADLVERHGGSFEAWNGAAAPAQQELQQRLGEKAVQFEQMKQKAEAEGKTLDSSQTVLLERQDPQFFLGTFWLFSSVPQPQVDAIVTLSNDLKRRGIDLIVLPVPTQSEVSATAFTDKLPPDRIIDPYRYRFLQKLLEADVEVVDLLGPFLEHKRRLEYLYYPTRDHHWAEDGILIGVQAIVERLARYDFVQNADKKGFTTKPGVAHRFWDNWLAKVPYPATEVFGPDGRPITKMACWKRPSPLLIIGDSELEEPAPGDGATGFIPLIAKETGILPGSLVETGNASQISRILAKEGANFLKEVRVCVFVYFGGTTDAWESVPVR